MAVFVEFFTSTSTDLVHDATLIFKGSKLAYIHSSAVYLDFAIISCHLSVYAPEPALKEERESPPRT